MNGAEEVKKHPFFRGVDWDNIRKMTAPFIPELMSDDDVRYFDSFPEQEPFYPPESKKPKKGRKDINFMNYTFNKDVQDKKAGIFNALEVLEAVKQTNRMIDDVLVSII